MNLTKNEKKMLNLLLINGKITDSSVANELEISSQAVGKIRKKLEKTVIDSYTIKLNYRKMGIQAFAISMSKLTQDGLGAGELQIEKKLIDNPHVLEIYRLPNSTSTHIILYGFKDLNELDSFFHSSANQKELFTFINVNQLFTFSHHSIIKNDPSMLFKKAIEGSKNPSKNGIPELEKFRKRME